MTVVCSVATTAISAVYEWVYLPVVLTVGEKAEQREYGLAASLDFD